MTSLFGIGRQRGMPARVKSEADLAHEGWLDQLRASWSETYPRLGFRGGDPGWLIQVELMRRVLELEERVKALEGE